MITTLLEITTTKLWMMEPEHLNATRMMIQDNIAGRVVLSAEQTAKRTPYCIGMTAEGEAVRMAIPGSRVEHDDNEPEVQQFVAILPVCGPITRNGDACSYGSVDLRDAMIEASNEEECAGIILYINSPGGSAAAIPDYKYAIEYAHQQNKKVIAFVDGMCASAAMYLAALCDERYYMNDKDKVGSIGVMAAFWTIKDGEKNQYTNETYHELYAKESYDKNKWHRDAAEGNYDELQADLDNLAKEFMADVKAACPNAKDEHLHGKMFEAKNISGILMDGKSTLTECLAKLVNEHHASSASQAQTQNTTIDMTNYPLINAACGLNAGEIAVKEEGAFMNAELLDALEAKLSAQEQEIAELKEAATHHQEAIDAAVAKANEEHTAAVETLNTEHAQAIEDLRTEFGKEKEALNTAHTEALQKKDEEIATLTSAKAEADEALKGAKEALATAEQTIADKDAQIAELSNDPGNEPAQGAAPQNNGEGAQVKTLREFDPSQYKTCAERKAAFEAFKRGEQV